jgi:hypothetical protein
MFLIKIVLKINSYLHNCEYDKQGGEDLHVGSLRVQVEQPEQNGPGVEAPSDTVKLKKVSSK